MRARLVLGAIVFILFMLVAIGLIYKLPLRAVEAGEYTFEEFREVVWVKYGLMIVVISVITSIVMVASVFAFRVSESIEGEGA